MMNIVCWPAEQIFSRLSASTHKTIAICTLVLAAILCLVNEFLSVPAPYSSLIAPTLVILAYLLSALLLLYMDLLDETQQLISSLSSQQLDARLGLSHRKTFQPLALLINTLGRQYQRLHHFVRSSAGEAQFTATELETTSLDMAKTAEEQHQRLASAAAAAEEISATLSQIASLTDNTKVLALSSHEACSSGKVQANAAIAEIRHVVDQVNLTETRLRCLQERSEAINAVTVSIEGISQQINLLALNASIEAARAGEAGRGFAVVADEVRNLALRTKEATVDIGNLLETVSSEADAAFDSITDSQERVTRAVEQVEKTGAALSQIQQAADQTREGVTTVSNHIREHQKVSDDMAATLEVIANLASRTRLSTEKTQDMVHYLNELSRRLNNHVPQTTNAH